MTKRTGNKRGRPRKLPDFVLRLGSDETKWNKWLTAMGLPEHSTSQKEVLQHRLSPVMASQVLSGETGGQSITQRTNASLSLLEEAAADESIVLSAEWQNYLEYIAVVAEHLSPKDKGATLKQLALEDARSRARSHPPQFPAQVGAPVEFRNRLADHELEIRLKVDRYSHIISIRVYQLPPDEDEDLDPAEEPPGHWEGLKWFRDPAE